MCELLEAPEKVLNVVPVIVDESRLVGLFDTNELCVDDIVDEPVIEILDERDNDSSGEDVDDFTGDRESEFVADVDLDTYTLGVKDFVTEPL